MMQEAAFEAASPPLDAEVNCSHNSSKYRSALMLVKAAGTYITRIINARNWMRCFDFARFIPAAYFFFFSFGSRFRYRKNAREPCDSSGDILPCYILIWKVALIVAFSSS